MARKTKEEANQTKSAILESALDVFCEKGYSRTTFEEIAKRIGLTKGAVYWHFDNKPQIIIALIKKTLQHINAEIDEQIPVINSSEDLINRFVYEAKLISTNPDYHKVLFFLKLQMEWSEALLSSIGDSLLEIKKMWVTYIKDNLILLQKKGEIQAKINIEELSILISSLWTGLLHHELGKMSPMDFPDMVKKSLSLIINSIKTERSFQ